MRRALVTTLPVPDCLERLRKIVGAPWSLLGDQPVMGRVGPNRARLRKRIGYRNSFQTILVADFRDMNGQTRIDCRTGMSPFVTVFCALWILLFTPALVGSLLAVAGFIPREAGEADNGLGTLIPGGMLLFVLVLVTLGRYVARNEQRFLLQFLRETLDAKDTGMTRR